MPRITVLGAGVCGLAAAVLLARDGHDVTVLERDPAPVPDTLDEALTSWERGGVAQFRQAHYVHPRGREVLDDCLPDIREALAAAGAYQFDVLGAMPPTIATARRARATSASPRSPRAARRSSGCSPARRSRSPAWRSAAASPSRL
jgi:2-polyprenyl-6-methoxyphenol hydroxylase-like FAD-dependent oxidoreductase